MNLPNALTAFRLAASPSLAVLALSGRPDLFLYVFLALEATDWLDGRLAVLLDQQTEFGARLDTVADMVMYSLLVGGSWSSSGRCFWRNGRGSLSCP